MQNFIFSGHSLILIPKCDATVRPTDGERLENWMPFQANRLSLSSRDFKVWNLLPLFINENDSGFAGGNGEDHVEIVVAPG